MRRQPGFSLVILFLTILLGVTLRLLTISEKVIISHDEAISYLAATANQGEYNQVRHEQVYPYGQWVEASEWKRFFQPTNPFAFRQIAADLAYYDIHPPLYFWLLHLFTLVFGVSAWVGPALNTLLFIVSAICLFGLASTLLKNRQEAALVVVIWATSPALLSVTTEARQYELFGTTTTIFVWVVVSYAKADRPLKWWWIALLGLATTAGALSHYHFALVVSGAVVVFWFGLVRQAPQRLAAGISAIIMGYGLFFLLHPNFLRSFRLLASRQRLQIDNYSTGIDFMRRLYATISTYTTFWVYGRVLQVIIFCIWLSAVIWLAMFLFRSRPRLIAVIQQTNLAGIEALYLFLWLAGIAIILYLSLVTPINGMTVRHMSAIWPFYAILPVLLSRFLKNNYRTGFLAGVCLMVAASGIISAISQRAESKEIKTAAYLETVDRIIVDSVHEGILPRFFFFAGDESIMLAADQIFLLEHPELWLTQLEAEDIYINDLSYTNTEENRAAILALLQQDFNPMVDGRLWFGSGTAFVLTPAASP